MAGRNEFDFRAEIENAEPTKRKMRELGKEAEDVGKKTEKGQQQAEKSIDSTGKATERLNRKTMSFKDAFSGMASAFAGIFAKAREEMAETDKQVDDLTNKMKGLREIQGLGLDPSLIKNIHNLQIQAALPGAQGFNEVKEAVNVLKSTTAQMTPEQRNQIMNEAIQTRQLNDVPLSDIVSTLTFMKKSDPDRSVNQLQNILKETQVQAGANFGEISQLAPDLLGIGKAAGLSTEQTFGLFSAATAVAPNKAKANVGVRNILSILTSEMTPDQEKIRQGLGISHETPVLEQLDVLAQSNLSAKDQSKLFGREVVGLSSLLLPAVARGDVDQTIGAIESAGATQADLTQESLDQINVPGTVFGEEFRLRRLRAQTSVAKSQRIKKRLAAKVREERARLKTVRQGGGGIAEESAAFWSRFGSSGRFVEGMFEGFGGDADPAFLRAQPGAASVDNSVNISFVNNPQLGDIRESTSP